jgi:hypothetical protein
MYYGIRSSSSASFHLILRRARARLPCSLFLARHPWARDHTSASPAVRACADASALSSRPRGGSCGMSHRFAKCPHRRVRRAAFPPLNTLPQQCLAHRKPRYGTSTSRWVFPKNLDSSVTRGAVPRMPSASQGMMVNTQANNTSRLRFLPAAAAKTSVLVLAVPEGPTNRRSVVLPLRFRRSVSLCCLHAFLIATGFAVSWTRLACRKRHRLRVAHRLLPRLKCGRLPPPARVAAELEPEPMPRPTPRVRYAPSPTRPPPAAFRARTCFCARLTLPASHFSSRLINRPHAATSNREHRRDVAPRPHHGASQLMQPCPGRLVALQPEYVAAPKRWRRSSAWSPTTSRGTRPAQGVRVS